MADVARGRECHTHAVPDLRLLVDDVAFAVRAVLVCQRHGKLLVEAGDYPFRNLPGGAVNIGEALEAGAVREWREETGVNAGPLRLLALVENFFELKGCRWHELGFYYGLDAPDALPDTQICNADHAVNHLDWVRADIADGKPIYPTAALSLLPSPCWTCQPANSGTSSTVKVKASLGGT